MRRRNRNQDYQPLDLGDGWYVDRDIAGSATVYTAMWLDAPGGFVIGGFWRTFSYQREAVEWVHRKRECSECMRLALEKHAEWKASPAGIAAEERSQKFNAQLREIDNAYGTASA